MRAGDFSYAPPALRDYGSLVELTAVTDLASGYDHSAAAADISFSGQTGGGGTDSGAQPSSATTPTTATSGVTPADPGTGGVQGVSDTFDPGSGGADPGTTGPTGTGGVEGVSQSGGIDPAGGAGGGGDPVTLGPGEAAGSLPFTGYPAAALAAAGGAVTALGGALRRLTRRS